MYPNAQDVLPFPPRPSLDQYKKRAKELVKAAHAGGPPAVRDWTATWIEDLVALHGAAAGAWDRRAIDRQIQQVEQFARARMFGTDADGMDEGRPTLAQAHFVIARAHGFASWPAFAAHLKALARAASPCRPSKQPGTRSSGDGPRSSGSCAASDLVRARPRAAQSHAPALRLRERRENYGRRALRTPPRSRGCCSRRRRRRSRGGCLRRRMPTLGLGDQHAS
jgi:hypothetical protein